MSASRKIRSPCALVRRSSIISTSIWVSFFTASAKSIASFALLPFVPSMFKGRPTISFTASYSRTRSCIFFISFFIPLRSITPTDCAVIFSASLTAMPIFFSPKSNASILDINEIPVGEGLKPSPTDAIQKP